MAIEARRSGWLPGALAGYVSTSHFVAIGIAFDLLALAEIVGLIFGLAESVARSVGKQIEILSLILPRQSFEILAEFAEPVRWNFVHGRLSDSRLLDLLVDAVASVVIFVLALTAPPPSNALLGVTAALHAVGLTLAYNKFAPILRGVKPIKLAADIGPIRRRPATRTPRRRPTRRDPSPRGPRR